MIQANVYEFKYCVSGLNWQLVVEIGDKKITLYSTSCRTDLELIASLLRHDEK